MSGADVEETVAAFNDATNGHAVDDMWTLVSDDVVFEGTTPPDGVRIEGDEAALRELWEAIFRDSPNAVVETEETTVCGDRCTALLRYTFDGQRPDAGYVRARRRDPRDRRKDHREPVLREGLTELRATVEGTRGVPSTYMPGASAMTPPSWRMRPWRSRTGRSSHA
jgi:ketosteroid isomerase-like protein